MIIGILAAQFSATWLGSNTGINLEIPMFRFLMALVGAGALLGATVAASTHLIERPDVVGVEGNTWETRGEFLGALRRALAIPLVAAVGIAAIVVIFGVLLLAAEKSAKPDHSSSRASSPPPSSVEPRSWRTGSRAEPLYFATSCQLPAASCQPERGVGTSDPGLHLR